MEIQISRQYTQITDPQRRVYNGCAFIVQDRASHLGKH